MIFKETHQLIPEHKWQTRRPVKPGEYAVVRGPGKMISRWHPGVPVKRGGKPLPDYVVILEVRDHMDRLKWRVGKDYAIQPGRGKKATRRTPPIKAIRQERLQEISCHDIVAEGLEWRIDYQRTSDGDMKVPDGEGMRGDFAELWNSLYRKPYRWEDDPEVWVLEFKGVKEEKDE